MTTQAEGPPPPLEASFDVDWWRYENLESGFPYDWSQAERGDSKWDNIDFHVDLGCGKLKKARLGIDHFYNPAVDLIMDLDECQVNPRPRGAASEPDETRIRRRGSMMLGRYRNRLSRWETGLPFPDDSIHSIITHHCLEHIGGGFMRLMDECHRVLIPGGVMRVIVPLFPSRAAVEDPDHKRYFMEGTFETFEGAPDGAHWHESFSVPYTDCRFKLCDKDVTPAVEPKDAWGHDDVREMRVALVKQF